MSIAHEIQLLLTKFLMLEGTLSQRLNYMIITNRFIYLHSLSIILTISFITACYHWIWLALNSLVIFIWTFFNTNCFPESIYFYRSEIDVRVIRIINSTSFPIGIISISELCKIFMSPGIYSNWKHGKSKHTKENQTDDISAGSFLYFIIMNLHNTGPFL